MHARFNSCHDKSSSEFKLTVVYFSNNPKTLDQKSLLAWTLRSGSPRFASGLLLCTSGIWDLASLRAYLLLKSRKSTMRQIISFVGCIISNLSDRLVRVYIDETEAKMLWDALVAKYMLHPQRRLLAAMYWLWLWVKLVRTKLAIQGIVYCSSCG